MEDDAFRLRLLEAPTEALEGYPLTYQERNAFIAGDLRGLLLAARIHSAGPDTEHGISDEGYA